MGIIEVLKDISKDVCLKSGDKIMQWEQWDSSKNGEYGWFIYDKKQHTILLITNDENAALGELLKKE